MMQIFTIEIAGVPAEIRCRFPENESFFRDYITDRTPLITVHPSAADLDLMQYELDIIDDVEGVPKHRREDAFLENIALHYLLVERMSAYGALLVHGSALCMDGQAVIFIAHSGTGKSTHTRLWRETFGERVWMINDDKPMLRIDGEKATVYGTPWDGRHHLSRNASAPLKALVRLTRDETNRIRPLAKADAFPMLLPHAYFSKDPETMAQILHLEKRLLDLVDFYLLHCNMMPEAAEVAHKEIFKPV